MTPGFGSLFFFSLRSNELQPEFSDCVSVTAAPELVS